MTIELTEEQIARILAKDESTQPYATTMPIVTDPEDVFTLLRHMGSLRREHVTVLTLNTRRRILAQHQVGVGVVDACLFHPREVFRPAILDNASSIVLVHNHPSGNPQPTEDDILVTRRVLTAGKVLGITLIDHVIIAGDSFTSLERDGRLQRGGLA